LNGLVKGDQRFIVSPLTNMQNRGAVPDEPIIWQMRPSHLGIEVRLVVATERIEYSENGEVGFPMKGVLLHRLLKEAKGLSQLILAQSGHALLKGFSPRRASVFAGCISGPPWLHALFRGLHQAVFGMHRLFVSRLMSPQPGLEASRDLFTARENVAGVLTMSGKKQSLDLRA